EIVMVQDIGEDQKAACASEIKSEHFGKNQISVHPVVGLYSCDQVVRHSIVFLSDDICHDHHAVKTFTMKGKGTFCDFSNMLGLDVQRCSEHG
ncbi:hypothetical protein BgiBS90_019374, partial [Biomphalaria glabrata]